MNAGKINKILDKELAEIKPYENEIKKIKEASKVIVEALKKELKRKKMKAEVFIGGSLAKNTIIKKEKYDIDIFVRFDKKYSEDKIRENFDKLIKSVRIKKAKMKMVHGSRDYAQLNFEKVFFEIVPSLKVGKPGEARNVTDLSYFHVNYIVNKIKKKLFRKKLSSKRNKRKKLADEIMLAKAFCYAQDCYGAESYIRGFSGYALELLVAYYGSFLNFLKAIASLKNGKIIIDSEKKYKNKQEIERELNSAKLESPIILIDPTFKERNATAALSAETFLKFKEACRKFLKNPSKTFFEKQEVDEEKLKKLAKRKKADFVCFTARTNKQAGDIAGSKLLKFYNLFAREIEKYFLVLEKAFKYNEKNEAEFFFVLKKKKEVIFSGPPIVAVENMLAFKKRHKNCFIKNGKVYAREKSKNVRDFFKSFKEKNKERIKNMSIINLSLS